MTGSERRKYVRIKTRHAIKHTRFSLLGIALAGVPEDVSKDISAGGILFDSVHSYTVGDLLRLEMALPGWEKYKSEFYKPDQVSQSQPVVALARVVRVEVMGPGKFDIGAQFVGIDDGHKAALSKYIHAHLRNQ